MTTVRQTEPASLKPIFSDAALPANVLTLDQLVQMCVRLQPAEAAARGDSSLCVTPLIRQIYVDGELVELRLVDGRWGCGYPRVSGLVQRAAGSAESKKKTRGQKRKSTQKVVDGDGLPDRAARAKGDADGYSEEEQLTRQIRHFVRHGQAFKIYSDCGLTGEYPCNDPRLIRRLLEGKAARYQKIFERTLLDETSLLRRTPEEVASMRAYLTERVARIKNGQLIEDMFAADAEGSAADSSTGDSSPADSSEGVRRGRGRPRNRVYFRQAFTQLWRDISAGLVHTVAVSDRSRLCRSADLESEFLVLLAAHKTRLIGLIEDLSTLDVSDPLKKGFAYLIASVNEYRLEETAGHSFRGILQLLESGHPHGRPPWWLVRDLEGRAVQMPEYAGYARRVAELYLSGLGVSAIISKLHAEGVLVGGEPLTPKMVRYVLESDAVSGLHWQFGLVWNLYPRLLPEEMVAEIQARRLARRDMLIPQFGERIPDNTAANHLFTGLLRCSCGLLLRYSHPSRNLRKAGRVGYYYCPVPHKRAEGSRSHAWMNENKLTAFMTELLGENPRLITQALQAGEDRGAQGAVRRALLEERLQQARSEYRTKEAAARAEAEKKAIVVGIGESSPAFGAIVEELSRELLEADREALASLEGELAQLSAQAGQDRQAARVLAAVEQLRGNPFGGAAPGDNNEAGNVTLDVRTQNRLLKAVFDEIVVYPLGPMTRRGKAIEPPAGGTDAQPRGCLVMRLAGVETPLPPVRMRRALRKDMRLPTIGEWISDAFALAPVEEKRDILNARTMRAFYQVLKDVKANTPVGRLAERVRLDPGFPRRSRGQALVAAHMASALYDGVREHLDAAWEHYRDTERRRLRAKSAASKRAGKAGAKTGKAGANTGEEKAPETRARSS